MSLAFENIRLKELAAVADINKKMFDHFEAFLRSFGYRTIREFIEEEDETKAHDTILAYLRSSLPPDCVLCDGVARPYPEEKAKWLFLGWLFRDAPEQRLKPMLKFVDAPSVIERKAKLFNVIRASLKESFPNSECWQWPAVREVIIDRLEGSRRSIKGTLFEAIVRRLLDRLCKTYGVKLTVVKSEVRLEGETYDVCVQGSTGAVLIPVKTRETMGGGHALLFARDIHKSISAAHAAGYECLPVVIAESWAGKLNDLACERFIHIDKNPNQIKIVEPLLEEELEKSFDFIRMKCLSP